MDLDQNMPDGSYTVKCEFGFKILHFNTQSLLPKIDEIKLLVNYMNIDILCITESWLNDSIGNDEVAINGYILYRNDWQIVEVEVFASIK